MGQLTWNGDAYLAYVAEVFDDRLGSAAEVIATAMRNNLSTDYPPASSPGESPHRRRGNLQAEVHVEKPGPLVRRIGSSVKYAAFLELGTRKMAARPFLLKSLMEQSDQLRQIVTGGTDARRGIQPFAPSFAEGFSYAFPTPNLSLAGVE
jgi:HK97 gp10 family phage protein